MGQHTTLAGAFPSFPLIQCVELVMAGRHDQETADLLTTQVSTTETCAFGRRSSVVRSVFRLNVGLDFMYIHDLGPPLCAARKACDRPEILPRTFTSSDYRVVDKRTNVFGRIRLERIPLYDEILGRCTTCNHQTSNRGNVYPPHPFHLNRCPLLSSTKNALLV